MACLLELWNSIYKGMGIDLAWDFGYRAFVIYVDLGSHVGGI